MGGMFPKHIKFTANEFAHNMWSDCIENMTGRFSAWTVIISVLCAGWLAFNHIDLGLFLITSAVIYSAYKQVERERNIVIALEDKLENKTERKANIAKIREFCDKGIAIRIGAWGINCEDDWKQWGSRYDYWVNEEMTKAMKEISENLSHLFFVRPNYSNAHQHPDFMLAGKHQQRFKEQFFILCDRLIEVRAYIDEEAKLEQQQHYVPQ